MYQTGTAAANDFRREPSSAITLRQRASEHCKGMNEICVLARDIAAQLGVPQPPTVDRPSQVKPEPNSTLEASLMDCQDSGMEASAMLHRILQHIGRA